MKLARISTINQIDLQESSMTKRHHVGLRNTSAMTNKKMAPQETSWPEWPYPEWRDEKILSAKTWLQGRRSDNGAEDLWRVHDELYDLTDFINKHPGGSDWLTLTKGTDITEAFEVHHLGPLAETLLPKFHVRSAKVPRNSPYTFLKNGFYRILKARVYEILKHKRKQAFKSVIILDILVAFTVILSAYAAIDQNYFKLTIYGNYYIMLPLISIGVAIVAGLCLCFTANCSHNFIHQRDNWRMYYFNMSLMSVREWRVLHVLSHHLYANTVLDMEMALLEPWFQWLPKSNKHWMARYFSTFYSPIVYPFIFHAGAIKRLFSRIFLVQDLIGLILPALMVIFGVIAGTPILIVLLLWTLVILSGSFFFGFIGVNVAHHHPDIFHDGDKPRTDRDWGLNQIDAVGDRLELQKCLFCTLISYGQHTLHHLFPSVDHSYLDELHPVLEKTCQEFQCVLLKTAAWDLITGQYRQLMRNKPNPIPHDKASVTNEVVKIEVTTDRKVQS